MKLLERFDRWASAGPFTALDLGAYRIVYAISTLCIVPGLQWLNGYPDTMYSAPPGPFQLMSGFPSLATLVALEIVRALALTLLAVGMWTRFASFATATLLLITYGYTYTLGKIDHTILLVVVPLVLAFANWGDRLSIDSLLRNRTSRPTPQWPLRYLALAIGLAFFVAAAMKLGTGWLDFSTQAVRGYALEYYLSHGRTSWLAGAAAELDVRLIWEILDWFTVLLEFAILAAVPWWRVFRISLAFAVLFHLGVFLVMNIAFAQNLVPYGAFIAWGTLIAVVRARTLPNHDSVMPSMPQSTNGVQIVALAVVLLSGVTAWWITTHTDALAQAVEYVTLFGGAATAIAYLASQARGVAGTAGQASNSTGRPRKVG